MKALKVPDHNTPPVLLTIDEARAMLRVGKQQFDDLRKAGLIDTVRFGRSVRVVAATVHSLPDRLRTAS
jgi:hypothetical protein